MERCVRWLVQHCAVMGSDPVGPKSSERSIVRFYTASAPFNVIFLTPERRNKGAFYDLRMPHLNL